MISRTMPWKISLLLLLVGDGETAGIKGHHGQGPPLAERGVERGSTRRSCLKGRERAIVNQTNNETVSKATLGQKKSEKTGWNA